ncbi:ATP-dependent RecD-like DNA helicase [Marinilactibacillus psychrotolerans]|uniref:ATP-dependent RecD2 DNA helicase n=2 Tax=Marinilactibacillus psychrotolerans TaxID=191770 RepID=A0A511GXY4_9LACT|nr:ATP-dependent RecD-like DNA helicase [Marinilactibacillus psychrotolerans]TLQ06639.1 ATP-dependent RecD-like DNA helicase [Marinilactibacillus psychrotolerans]SDB97080.1 exodeoxyribonuclease V alpha subunit [Marinilactibacillus psychrotolerans]SJN37034.1 RecD-like DNA helicase YrrC [Marinilactibacillus psychrotolerans 42ea]GEL66126.1 ATP-dependent RecD-like DNA helicase [Marinilactibacillus psychrotolerans]GEQ33923.1 exodeoxyribonuclease V subunit alpha [Marinilactibacillus psychrotolerans]
MENETLQLEENQEKYIVGEVSAIYFSNPSNFYKVMLVDLSETNTTYDGTQIVITGNFGQVTEGETYQFYGKLTDHPKYGLQFLADRYAKKQPSSGQAVVSYLSSSRFKGIGKKTAESIVNTLGEGVLDLILDDPNHLDKVPGLNQTRKQMIMDVLEKEQGMQRVILALNKFGLGNQLAYKVYQKFEGKTLSIIQENPYQLIKEIEGIGFNRADTIADEIGIKADAPERLQASILYSIHELTISEGDTFALSKPLLTRSIQILEESRPFIINPDSVADNVIELVRQQEIIQDEDRFYIPSLFASEWGVSTAIERLLSYSDKIEISSKQVEKKLSHLEKAMGIEYGDSQRSAIEKALHSPVFLLTGGPGTGKTTVLKGIVNLFAELNDLSLDPAEYKDEAFPILLAAPTGRAAKRMKETTGLPASTIHRLLGLTAMDDEESLDDSDRNLKGKLLVIDEMSMVDTWLAYQLFKSIPNDMQVIMVGDKDQLPSVGPGQVLRDFLESEVIPKSELKDIYRQGNDSSIIPLAHKIKENQLPDDFKDKKKDRSFFPCTTSKVLDVITQVVTKAISRGYTAQEVQVLAPMYKGPAGINVLNKHLQNLFNPNEHNEKKEVNFIDNVYRIGDKVLQLVNDPERNVFNGDMGIITGIIPSKESETKTDNLIIDFEGNEVTYLRNEWNKLTLAYCCSIHKAQGSEYDMVILPMVNGYRRMLKKDLLYTAVTRASHFLILCGEENAYRKSLQSTSMLRKTTLKERLLAEQKSDSKLTAFTEKVNEETPNQLEGYKTKKEKTNILTPLMVEKNVVDPLVGMADLSPYTV